MAIVNVVKVHLMLLKVIHRIMKLPKVLFQKELPIVSGCSTAPLLCRIQAIWNRVLMQWPVREHPHTLVSVELILQGTAEGGPVPAGSVTLDKDNLPWLLTSLLNREL